MVTQNKTILHIDFNSYFATVEQQANPRLRGKPIGVTGGDRMERTVVGAASVEAKEQGVRTGMSIGEARKICPELILVRGDSDKYLACTKRFLNILKAYSPYMEVFSIDEVFLELESSRGSLESRGNILDSRLLTLATDIKQQIRAKVGEWITVSVGISYNKFLAKLAGSLQKPDGLVVIADETAARMILDQVELDAVCGIGGRIKKRLNNMGVFDFQGLRKVPKEALLASFKSYGEVLYNMARGVDHSLVLPFYEKEEVKSVGHRHTINHDTADPLEIKQLFLKLTELVARKLRSKKLVGKTVSVWYRAAFNLQFYQETGVKFYGDGPSSLRFEGAGMQLTIPFTQDGLEIFEGAWRAFLRLWDKESVRMVGVSISNLKPLTPQNMSLFKETYKREKIIKALDQINDRYGEFTLHRGVLLGTPKIYRKPNSFLADRRFKI